MSYDNDSFLELLHYFTASLLWKRRQKTPRWNAWNFSFWGHDPATRDVMPADRKPKVIHWVNAKVAGWDGWEHQGKIIGFLRGVSKGEGVTGEP